MLDKKILIIGGAGFVGHYLTQFLSNLGFRIFVLDKNDPLECRGLKNVKFVKADVMEYDAVLKAAQGMNVIIAAHGVQPFNKPKQIYQINVAGTENILKAAKVNKVAKVVFMSSASVYGAPSSVSLKEDAPLSGDFHLAKSKIMAESLCEKYRQQGMIITIFRPTPFIGPTKLGMFGVLFEWIKEARNIPLLGQGSNRLQLTDIDDFCQAMLLAINADDLKSNQTFNIASDGFSSTRENIQYLMSFTQSKSKILSISPKPLKFIIYALGKLRICPSWIKNLFLLFESDLILDTGRIKNNLNWQSRNTNKQSLLNAYKWYLANGQIVGKKGDSNRSVVRSGLLSIVKRFF